MITLHELLYIENVKDQDVFRIPFEPEEGNAWNNSDSKRNRMIPTNLMSC